MRIATAPNAPGPWGLAHTVMLGQDSASENKLNHTFSPCSVRAVDAPLRNRRAPRTARIHQGGAVLALVQRLRKDVSRPTVAAARIRVAAALRHVLRARLAGCIEEVAAATNTQPMPGPQGLQVLHLRDADSHDQDMLVRSICGGSDASRIGSYIYQC